MRLFVALELPEPVRAQLGMLAGGIPGARWVAPENMHLTLRFIGEVDEGTVADIDLALADIDAPGFEMSLEGVGHFGSARQARAIYVGVARNAALAHLYAKIESALVRCGLEPEGRKFSPHVTLARLRDAPASRISSFVAGHNLFRAGPIEVDGFVLYSSFLSHSGPIYRPERFYPLAPEEGMPDEGD
jgi:2'-5' RNA ligase